MEGGQGEEEKTCGKRGWGHLTFSAHIFIVLGSEAGSGIDKHEDLQGHNLEGLEIPDQAYDIGPPPAAGSSRTGRRETSQQERRRGGSPGQILADLENQTGPSVGPVYEVLSNDLTFHVSLLALLPSFE